MQAMQEPRVILSEEDIDNLWVILSKQPTLGDYLYSYDCLIETAKYYEAKVEPWPEDISNLLSNVYLNWAFIDCPTEANAIDEIIFRERKLAAFKFVKGEYLISSLPFKRIVSIPKNYLGGLNGLIMEADNGKLVDLGEMVPIMITTTSLNIFPQARILAALGLLTTFQLLSCSNFLLKEESLMAASEVAKNLSKMYLSRIGEREYQFLDGKDEIRGILKQVKSFIPINTDSKELDKLIKIFSLTRPVLEL